MCIKRDTRLFITELFPGTLLANDVTSIRCEMAIDQRYTKKSDFQALSTLSEICLQELENACYKTHRPTPKEQTVSAEILSLIFLYSLLHVRILL